MDTIDTVDIPVDLVGFFEAAVRRQGIGVDVTYHDDGSRSYRAEPGEWDESAVIHAAEEAVERLRTTLARRGEGCRAG